MKCPHIGRFVTAHSDAVIHHCEHFEESTVIEGADVQVPGGIMRKCQGCPILEALSKKPASPEPTIPVGRQRNGRFCYYSASTSENGATMIGSMIRSARAAGVKEDFHTFSLAPVDGEGVYSHPIDPRPWYHMRKIELLRDELASLDYDYFVWLDSDTWFVRHPGDLLPLLRNNPVWIQMESEMTSELNRQGDWWGARFVDLFKYYRTRGVRSQKLWNTNGGMFIVRKEVIVDFATMAFTLYDDLKQRWPTTEDETPLAIIGHILVDDPSLNTNAATGWTWCCDWMGRFKDQLPDGKPWLAEDWMTGETRVVNAAIVHAMRSKHLMAHVPGYKPPEFVTREKRKQMAEAFPCIHRGQIGRIDEQPPCKGGPEPIYGCALHGECSIAKYCPGQKVPACTGCNDRTESTECESPSQEQQDTSAAHSLSN